MSLVVGLVPVEASERIDMDFQLLQHIWATVDEPAEAGKQQDRRRYDCLLVSHFVWWIVQAVGEDAGDMALHVGAKPRSVSPLAFKQRDTRGDIAARIELLPACLVIDIDGLFQIVEILWVARELEEF